MNIHNTLFVIVYKIMYAYRRMDPSIDNEWLGCKNDPVDEAQSVGNVARSWQWREHGINPPHSLPNKTVLENIAEDILVRKQLKIRVSFNVIFSLNVLK